VHEVVDEGTWRAADRESTAPRRDLRASTQKEHPDRQEADAAQDRDDEGRLNGRMRFCEGHILVIGPAAAAATTH